MSLTRRTVLLASVALAAISFAPAVASASGTWTSGGKALKEDAFVNLTGFIQFDMGAFGSFSCDVHAKMVMTATVEGGGTGHLEEINFTTASCVGEGAMKGCKVEKDQITKKAPWMLTATKEDISLSTTFMHFSFAKGCIFGEIGGAAGDLTLDPDKPTEFTELEVTDDPEEIGLDASGELEVVGEGAGAYGVH